MSSGCRAMRLDEEQVPDLLEAYEGPRNEVEKQTLVSTFIIYLGCFFKNSHTHVKLLANILSLPHALGNEKQK